MDVQPLGVEYVFASLPAFVQYARIFPPANGTLIPAIVGSKDVASAVQPIRALRYATITAAVSADEPEVLNEYEAGSELAMRKNTATSTVVVTPLVNRTPQPAMFAGGKMGRGGGRDRRGEEV